jgi:Ca2+/Na+ antiporter
MGTTILAAGTSVPDALGSISAAKDGMAGMAVSNAIGSNIFDICLGLGIPYVIKTGMVSPGSLITVHANMGDLVEAIIILFGTLVALLLIMVATRWQLNRVVGGVLFVLYVVFVVYQLAKHLA